MMVSCDGSHLCCPAQGIFWNLTTTTCPRPCLPPRCGANSERHGGCGPSMRLENGVARCAAPSGREEESMLWTIFVILVIMWLLGMVSSYTLGGYIHLLLILAIAVVLIRIIQGRRPI